MDIPTCGTLKTRIQAQRKTLREDEEIQRKKRKMTVPSEVKTGELAAVKVQGERYKLWDEHLMRMKEIEAALSKANNSKLAAQGIQVRALEEDTVALEGKMTAHSEVMTGELAVIKVQDKRHKLWDERLMRMKKKRAARSKAYNIKLAAQGNQVRALEEDTVALEEKVAPLKRDFSRVELVVTEVEERQAHSQKIDSMDKETQTSELPHDENNALQEELMELRASYNEVCQNQTINEEKWNTELQEKNVLQEQLVKLRASYREVCLNQTINEEKLNTELQEKNVLQEQLVKLRASYREVCLNQTINEEKLNAELQEKNILQEQLVKLRASYREVCLNQTINEEKLNTELQEEKQENNVLQEQLMELRASHHEVCQNQTLNEEKWNAELQEKNILQEQLMKLRASYREVCQNQTINEEKWNTELQEKNVLQEQLVKLRASYREVCLNQTINEEKWNAELQEKNVLQEQLVKLRASYREVCLNQTINEEKWNAELQEKKVLQEQLVKLRASHHEVCQNQTLNQEKFNTELQVEKQEKKLLEEELLKLQASYHEVCSLLYAADVSSGQLNGESKEDVTEEKSLSSVLPEKQKKPSVWKRFRHALGLRKPQSWKKSAAPSNST
ncbi:golgin subfamily A member 6-like protein 22 isoform X2 [Paralichthys olivaceus]|uniref:golgin subfamily A member 6-like protein 22 isoform X2 n=1 Tax=Paralichthys olivaceus TaxID=8255 RepID=UPI003753010A